MRVGKIRGIVIGERQQGESSKQLTVLAKGAGKLYLSARGAKNTKSRLLAGAQLFAYCDFTLFAKNGFASVNQIDLLDSFYGLRNDVSVLSQAVYLAELADRICPLGMEQDDILLLLLHTLKHMEKGGLPPKLAGRIFEIKSLFFSGLFSDVECAVCADAGDAGDAVYFDMAQGCFLCQKHKTQGAEPLLPAVQKALTYVLEEGGKDIFAFRLSEEALAQLDKVLRRYIQIHIGVDLQSRRFAADICF